MATIIKKIIWLTILSIIMTPQIIEGHVEQVPCSFFFGDSQFDNGNNNLLSTRARSNYPPYGIDYLDGPTGRFTNGHNIADYIAQLLGFDKPIPPFATASNSEIRRGVNYASGAAGIHMDTGYQLGDRISMDRQLLHHRTIISRLSSLLKSSLAVDNHLRKCLYIVNIGANDYLNNYFLPKYYPTSHLFTPDQFAENLIEQYSRQLRTLYFDGARKIAVFGLGSVGCVPAAVPKNGSACVEFMNDAAQLFNNRLVPLLDVLNNNLPGVQFTYINITSISEGDPSTIGITINDAPCCEVGSNGQCTPNDVPCGDRNHYIFFDNYHPTEIMNLVTAKRAYTSLQPSDAYPMDIQTLVRSRP